MPSPLTPPCRPRSHTFPSCEATSLRGTYRPGRPSGGFATWTLRWETCRGHVSGASISSRLDSSRHVFSIRVDARAYAARRIEASMFLMSLGPSPLHAFHARYPRLHLRLAGASAPPLTLTSAPSPIRHRPRRLRHHHDLAAQPVRR